MLICSLSSTAQPTTTDLELAAALGRALEKCRAEKDIGERHLVQACEIQLNAEKARHAIRLDAVHASHNVEKKALEAKLDATEKARLEAEAAAERKWFENPLLWAGAGLVTGAALTTTIVILSR